MLLVVAMLSFLAAAFFAINVATEPSRRRRDALKRAAGYGTSDVGPAESSRRARRGFLDPFWAAIAKIVVSVLPRTSRESVEKRLVSAGLAPRISADQFLAGRALITVFGLLLGIAMLTSSPLGGIAFIFCFVYLGLFGPDVYVNSRIRGRKDRVQAALSDALDLLAVSVEAGLSFEGAVAKLVEYMTGPLIEEFALTLNEIRIGQTRADALRRMEARLDVPEVTAFVRAVIQAEQLGASMGAILRAQGSDARVHRQLAAEEKAMKLPIKMLVPMAIFILPATFIVVLGSALLKLGDTLS
jgi:tight adherence protein C